MRIAANPPSSFYACYDIRAGKAKPADLVASGQGVTGGRARGSGQAVKAKAGQLGAGWQVADQ